LDFSHLARSRGGWHGARNIEQRASRSNFEPTQHPLATYWRTDMQIENLSKELDTKEMTAVTGGDNGNAATNNIGQEQRLVVPVAVGAGGPANTTVHVDGSQYADIFNYQDAGDSFKALFPTPPAIR
jgi:hypothetical protein